MRNIFTFIIVTLSFLGCTKELEENLTNIDTWKWSHSKTVFGTNIKVTETKEISFRNKTIVDLIVNNQKDTLLYKKSSFVWSTTLLNTINILEEGNKYPTKIDVQAYSLLNLHLSGFPSDKKIYKFTPKNSH